VECIGVIEPACREDCEAIAALNVAAYEEFAPQLQPGAWEAMRRTLCNVAERAGTAEFLIVREAGEIIGSVAYCPAGKSDPSIFESTMASVLLLAVHPQHRGRGLAKALTAACIARARRDNAGSVGLFTGEIMHPARHVYRSLGFRLEAELPPRHGVRYFRYVLPVAGTAADAEPALHLTGGHDGIP
jgi:ribosomal protein S18 acetylase RimI-like enzyme